MKTQQKQQRNEEPTFDLQRDEKELVDELAERQAKKFPYPRLKSTQLRKFFGEVKDLYRRLTQGQDYEKQIEPEFKMLRSKVYYAHRKSGEDRVPREFVDFIDNGVKTVKNKEDFEKFVRHFEAVVGFWYGKYGKKES